MQKHGKDKGGSPMRKIKYVFALLAAVLALTTAALAAEPGDALVPVGETVAISLRCDGVVVSALADIASEGGACCPAGEAGVQAGDKIVAVNGERVTGAEDFLRCAAAFSGEGVTLSVERGGESMEKQRTAHRVGRRSALTARPAARSGLHAFDRSKV